MGTLYVMQGGTFVEQGGGGGGATGSANSVTPAAVTVTASATPHTKGSWTQLIASTSHAAETLVVTILPGTAQSGQNRSTQLDIGIGAAASETVLIPDIQVGHTLNLTSFVFPISVAAGTRISARCRSATASQTVGVLLSLRQAGDHSAAPTTATAYGVNAAASQGTTLTIAGAINTESAWTEISASTADDISRMVVTLGAAGGTTLADAAGNVDIGYGASSSEVEVVTDIPYEMSSAEQIRPMVAFPYSVTIPAGSRLVARYKATVVGSGTTPTVTVIGLS
jgi:hypothetical protein